MKNKYVKKPIPITAIQWTGENYSEIQAMNSNIEFESDELIIPTLEGRLRAKLFDFIIKGVRGECYPCQQDIFNETYEKY